VPGEAGVAGAAVAGDACVPGDPAAGATDAGRDGAAGSSVGSGKLVTVSALSQPPLAGSSSQRPICCVCGLACVATGARGAGPGETAGGRGDGATAGARGVPTPTRAAPGTGGGAPRGAAPAFTAFGTTAVGEDAAFGRIGPAGRAGAAPGRASRDSLTPPASLFFASRATRDDLRSTSAQQFAVRFCSPPLPSVRPREGRA
jgi:hypothetical protein